MMSDYNSSYIVACGCVRLVAVCACVCVRVCARVPACVSANVCADYYYIVSIGFSVRITLCRTISKLT